MFSGAAVDRPFPFGGGAAFGGDESNSSDEEVSGRKAIQVRSHRSGSELSRKARTSVFVGYISSSLMCHHCKDSIPRERTPSTIH